MTVLMMEPSTGNQNGVESHAFCIIQHARWIAVYYLFCFVTLHFAQVDHFLQVTVDVMQCHSHSICQSPPLYW